MTISPILQLTAMARVTPADALSVTTNVDLGYNGLDLGAVLREVATDANLVYTKSFTLPTGTTKSINMETLQIADIDASPPRNADGSTFTLTKIYALILRFVSQSTAGASGVRMVKDTWTQTLDVTLGMEEALALLVNPEGFAVASTNNLCNITETGGVADVVVQLFVIGKD